MQLLDSAGMREADRRTIQEVGIPGRVLMENAGRAIVTVIREHVEDLEELAIAVVCGKGNNGGDGLVVLRVLLDLGYDARGFVLAPFEDLSADAIDNLQAALKLGLPVVSAPTDEAWQEVLPELATADVIVDAILGTGLTEAARGLSGRAIDDINQLDALKVAVDVPSGLSSDAGAVPGAAVVADLTVALGAAKICHYLLPAAELCGHVETVDIGIPRAFLVPPPERAHVETIETRQVKAFFPEVAPTAHKGTFGHLLVVAGSVGKTGAAIMTAKAALRSGAGLVTVASPRSAIAMMAPALPEAMWEPLEETELGAIAQAAEEQLLKLADERSAVALGPGLGLDDETVRVVLRLVEETPGPIVVDADGLNALARARGSGGAPSLIALRRQGALALTPHPGEAGRLLACSAAEVERNRLSAARKLASDMRAHVLLKGFRSLVCDPEGNVRVNLTGNPGMATGGTGDVLTGVAGALLAQGLGPADALTAAAHIHGLAGDLAAEEKGRASLMATDVIDSLPAAFLRVTAR